MTSAASVPAPRPIVLVDLFPSSRVRDAVAVVSFALLPAAWKIFD